MNCVWMDSNSFIMTEFQNGSKLEPGHEQESFESRLIEPQFAI